MIRLWNVRRRRRPLMVPAADDRELQRRILDLVLEAHPLPVDFDTLASRLSVELADPREVVALATAIRDLVAAGLLRSDGLCVSATRAALTFAHLEAGR